MPTEYKVVPAPRRGVKGKGLKSSEDRFANALTQLMNEMAAEGWQFLRSETLPVEERQGLTGRNTVYQSHLVFARSEETLDEASEILHPAAELAETRQEPVLSAPVAEEEAPAAEEEAPEEAPAPEEDAPRPA